jgi:protein AroM
VRGKKALFITIGQSPRPDILDEMRPWWNSHGAELDVIERGALDGLSTSQIERLGPGADDTPLVSRLGDGSEVTLGSGWVHHRVQEIVLDAEEDDFDFLVLLCTGRFPDLRSKRLVVKAGPVLDRGLEAFREAAPALGVLVPHEKQEGAFLENGCRVSHMSPYSTNGQDDWDEAARKLRGSDLIALHCMGYNESMRARMAEATGKPVVLARRMLAAAVAQIL